MLRTPVAVILGGYLTVTPCPDQLFAVTGTAEPDDAADCDGADHLAQPHQPVSPHASARKTRRRR